MNPEERTSSSSWTVATVVFTMTNFMPYKKGEPQTWYPIYLSSQVLTIGTRRVDEQARTVVAAVDAALEQYRRAIRE